jgi:hypothetical protein
VRPPVCVPELAADHIGTLHPGHFEGSAIHIREGAIQGHFAYEPEQVVHGSAQAPLTLAQSLLGAPALGDIDDHSHNSESRPVRRALNARDTKQPPQAAHRMVHAKLKLHPPAALERLTQRIAGVDAIVGMNESLPLGVSQQRLLSAELQQLIDFRRAAQLVRGQNPFPGAGLSCLQRVVYCS